MFLIYVQPAYRVDHCRASQADEARGCFGLHLYTTCSDCRRTFEGLELWGENGHRQGRIAPDAPAVDCLTARLTRDRTLCVTGGAAIYYQGRNL